MIDAAIWSLLRISSPGVVSWMRARRAFAADAHHGKFKTMRSRDRLQLDPRKILHVGLERTEAFDLLKFRSFERPLTGDFIDGSISRAVADPDEPSGRKPAGTRKQIGKMRVLVPGAESGLMLRIDIDPHGMDEGLVGHHSVLKPD